MKPKTPPFSNPVAVATLHGVAHLRLVPDAGQRAAMARFCGLRSITAFEALLDITARANGVVEIKGQLHAEVEPVCVVSMEPFSETIREEIEASFAEAALIEKLTRRAEENGVIDFEPPDLIENGVIDPSALSLEWLMLALDPYPRKPGAEFQGLSEDIAPLSPFAALKALKPE